MTSKGLTGKIAEAALGRAGITVNKNLIPFDTRKPLDPSGIRMGTPALTTRGMKEDAIRQVAAWIVEVASARRRRQGRRARFAGEIREFARDYPVPADLAATTDLDAGKPRIVPRRARRVQRPRGATADRRCGASTYSALAVARSASRPALRRSVARSRAWWSVRYAATKICLAIRRTRHVARNRPAQSANARRVVGAPCG